MKSYKYRIILILFLIKGFSVFYLIHLSKCNNPERFIGIANYSGDASSYITPIDNFIKDGDYYFESAKAGRMPYLGLVYLPFRLLFSKPIALGILVVLQILMESIAIYYMARLCEHLFQDAKTFWLFIFLSSVSLNTTIFDYAILSESFGISFLCFFVYHYYVLLTGNRNSKQLIITGFFFALTVLFKPYFSLLLVLVWAEIIWNDRFNFRKLFLKKIVKQSLLIVLPLIIINAPWTIRNYMIFNKFIPFQQDIYAGYNYSPADDACRTFIQTIGESYLFWDKRSAGSYFKYNNPYPCDYKFPERIFAPGLTMYQIDDARQTYMDYQKNPSDSLEKQTIIKFNKLSETYKTEHPFFYYLGTPLILCKNFLINSGSYYLPIEKKTKCYYSYQWAIKLSQSLMYYLCLIFGFAGIGIMLFVKPKSFIIFSIPVYLILFFPLILKRTEFRYFAPSYPFLLIGLTYIIITLRSAYLNQINIKY